MNKLVSIVIVTRRYNKILECINRVLKQSYTNYEVVVVWNGSESKFHYLNSIYKLNKNVKLVKDGSNNVSKGRNIGIHHANGSYVAFTDDDCIVDNKWLEELMKAITDGNIAGAGSIRDVENRNKYYAYLWQLAYMKIGDMDTKYKILNKNIYLCTSSALYKKQILINLNGFDETLTSGEDSDMSVRVKRIGYNLKLVPSAKVTHYHPESIIPMIKQQLWYGFGDYFLYKKHEWGGFTNTVIRVTKGIFNRSFDALAYSVKERNIKLAMTFPMYVAIMEVSRFIGYIQGYVASKSRK